MLVRGKRLTVPYDQCAYSAKSIMFRKAPVRIAAGEFDWLRQGDTWSEVAARAAALGVEVTQAELRALNDNLDPTAAPLGTKVRIRQPWAPLARTLNPAPSLTSSNGNLSWTNPGEALVLPAGSGAPTLYARDWDGDGIDDLLLATAPTSAGLALDLTTLKGERFSLGSRLSRQIVTMGWVLR